MHIYQYHTWQKVPKPSYFRKTTPILPTRPFQIFSYPLPLPPPHCSFCCLVSLAEWVIAPYLMLFLLNDIMDLQNDFAACFV